MSTRKSILYGFLAIVTLCATALVYAARKNSADKLPSSFIQQADRAAVHATGGNNGPRKVAHIGDIEVTPTRTPEQNSSASNGQVNPLTRSLPRDTGAMTDDGGIPVPPGGIHVAGPTATPAELGYSPQAIYDAQQYNSQMQYAPQYDQYGQQVIEAQGTSGYVYDPYYGYGYGFGYGPVTNSGEPAFNGQAYAPQTPGRPGDFYQQAQNFDPTANSAPAPGAVGVARRGAQTPPTQNVPQPVSQPTRPAGRY